MALCPLSETEAAPRAREGPGDRRPALSGLAGPADPADPSDFSDLRRIHLSNIDGLDNTYRRLLIEADRIRKGVAKYKPFEYLLDQTRPTTPEEMSLAMFVGILASFERGKLIAYLFQIRRACLLLLLGPKAILTALNLEGYVEIAQREDGRYEACPADPGTARGGSREAAGPEGPRGGRDARRRADRSSRRDDRGGGRDDRGGGRDDRGGRRGAGRAESRTSAQKGASGRPVMDMARCMQVLSRLDSAVAEDEGPQGVARADPEPQAEPLPRTAKPIAGDLLSTCPTYLEKTRGARASGRPRQARGDQRAQDGDAGPLPPPSAGRLTWDDIADPATEPGASWSDMMLEDETKLIEKAEKAYVTSTTACACESPDPYESLSGRSSHEGSPSHPPADLSLRGCESAPPRTTPLRGAETP